MIRKKLRNNYMRSQTNVNELDIEEKYGVIGNEYDRIYYLRMNYDIGIYDEINNDELNVETNQTVECTEILE
jgi:hypothetical protein